MALPTSGNEINFGALPDNRSSASKANISLKQESEFFAIGAVGPTGTSRANLNSEPYAISEFGGANYPNSVFSEVVAKLSTTTVGEYVDGETGARIYWDVDDGTTDNYTAGLKLVSDNSIVISETLDFDGSGATKYVTLGAIPNIAEATDKYYPFVTTGTYTNAVSSSIDHFDQIAGTTINAVSVQTLDASSETNAITFGLSTSAGTVTSRAWTFSNASNGDNSAISLGSSTSATPTVTYTGTGLFPVNLIQYGNPSTSRNNNSAAAINVDVRYNDAIDSLTIDDTTINVSSVDGSNNATFTCYSEGYDGTLTIGYDTNSSTGDTSYTNTTEAVDTLYQRESISKNFTISSAGTYYPKAHHGGSATVGSSFIVAPALAYSTTNDQTIDVGATQGMAASVSAGTNASVAITSSPNIGGGTNSATMTPGSNNGRYTISYAGTADYLPNNVNNQTDILTVRPKIDSLTPSPSTVYGLGSYTSGYTPTGVSTTNTTVTAVTTGTISGTGYSWTKPSGTPVGGGGTGDSTVTMNFSGASGTKTFNLTVSGHAIGSVDTTSTQASANVTYVAYTQQNITSVTPTSGDYRRGATSITVGWTSINVALVDIYLMANNTSYTTNIQQANAYDSLTSANTSEGRSYSAAIVDVGRSNVGRYNVRVQDAADTLPSTTAVSTINVLDTAPTTPGAFQDTAGGYNTSLVMSWAASSYVYQYILEKSDGDSDGSYNTTLATQTGTSYNLTAGSTSTYGPFYYRVRAKNFAQDGLTTEYSNYNTARRFLIYPTLTTSKNQITPSSATITTAGSVSFSTPQPATDNVSKYVYSTNSHCSITNSTQGDGSSVISHTTAVLTSTSVGTKTINLTVSGLSGQNNISGGSATITVNYAPEVTLVSVTGATPTWYTSTSLTVNTGWQGFALNTVADNLQIKLFNSSNNQVGSTQTIYGNSIGQGSAGGTANYNHTWGTISGVATGYYFKSIAYDDENQASYEATSATFDIDGVSSYTVYGQEIFWNAGIIGYDTLISAADTTADGSNTNITETLYAITGTLADGVVLYDDEDLEPAHKFDGNYKYFKAGSYCFKIKGDTLPRGEIDDIRSIVP
ncbi:MAG: hypothetical protein CL722_03630, partial [Chloroflexi bacterium]|nr:hypothetical protein [Chloroflexota bacterium]